MACDRKHECAPSHRVRACAPLGRHHLSLMLLGAESQSTKKCLRPHTNTHSKTHLTLMIMGFSANDCNQRHEPHAPRGSHSRCTTLRNAPERCFSLRLQLVDGTPEGQCSSTVPAVVNTPLPPLGRQCDDGSMEKSQLPSQEPTWSHPLQPTSVANAVHPSNKAILTVSKFARRPSNLWGAIDSQMFNYSTLSGNVGFHLPYKSHFFLHSRTEHTQGDTVRSSVEAVQPCVLTWGKRVQVNV